MSASTRRPNRNVLAIKERLFVGDQRLAEKPGRPFHTVETRSLWLVIYSAQPCLGDSPGKSCKKRFFKALRVSLLVGQKQIEKTDEIPPGRRPAAGPPLRTAGLNTPALFFQFS